MSTAYFTVKQHNISYRLGLFGPQAIVNIVTHNFTACLITIFSTRMGHQQVKTTTKIIKPQV
jgi:hypothetical protein